MRTAHKVAISLLIAVLVFSGVAVLSFTGFFDFIETNFYNQRVRSSFFNQLDNRADSIKKYHKLQIDRFTSILNEDFVKRIYLPNRSREDIFNQESVLGKLEENVPELLFIRFLDAEGTRIHFSTLEEDIKSRNDFRVVYKTWAEAEYTADPQKLLVSENEEPKVLLDSSLNALIYSFPSYDTYDIYRGSALFYLSTEGLQTHLVEEGVIGVGTNIILTESSGLVFGLPSGYRTEEVREQLNSTIRNFNSEEGMKSLFTTEEGQEYFIFLKKMERGSFTGIVVSGRIFELHPIMKIILLSAVFVTAFLLTYLLFNIKQDVILVLSERIKRFQIKLLSEYIESKDEIQWDRWQKDLQLRRNEVKEEIKRGLGRFSKKKEPEVDALIDQSWDEIIEVMGKRAGAISQESTGNIDMQRLETMLQQIMNKTQFVVPASSTTSAQPQEKPAGTVSAQEPVEVEEVSEETGEEEEIEELEEPEELEEAGSEEETREETEEAPEKAEETPPTELTGEPVEVEEVSEATGEEEEI
ncbi:MAG: hypothetical protein K9L68_04370, partial [Spirochaetales bacterium]|nr:hypothetical protein [Spirochaetales bacterium]MCF7937812.1 hypothetical protein [Spirochaetales bacterium]